MSANSCDAASLALESAATHPLVLMMIVPAIGDPKVSAELADSDSHDLRTFECRDASKPKRWSSGSNSPRVARHRREDPGARGIGASNFSAVQQARARSVSATRITGLVLSLPL